MKKGRKFVSITREKLESFCEHLKQKGVDAFLIQDFENGRSSSLRYFSGHPEDAMLIILASGRRILIPWDVIMAEKVAGVEEIVDFGKKGGSYFAALETTLKDILGDKYTIELQNTVGYLEHKYYKKRLKGAKIVVFDSPKKSADYFINRLRMHKSQGEIKLLKKACEITNTIIQDIEKYLKKNKKNENFRENSLSLFVEMKALEYGCDSVSFETIVANPDRSWSIHTNPRAGSGKLVKPGLSLVDFGVTYKGYKSDVTVSFSLGKLSKIQEKMIHTVENAQREAIKVVKPGVFAHQIAEAADLVIKKAGMNMPHSLGHGIGLDVHDPGRIVTKPKDEKMLKRFKPLKIEEGMVFTIEPGVYHTRYGGCRLEDDVLVTDTSCEVLTKSRFMRI
ncbi:aminopeptidase P family protein [candidate division WOR-3 bacterium]|nr:aminopeptidase P family protein [candidate division WOR-3 bacterium]